MFKTRSDYNRKGFSVSNFPKERPTFALTIKNGKKVLEKTGSVNVYNAIQEAVPETCLINIINRLTKGDTSAVGDVVGGFVDVTTMPKNLMEAQNLMIFSEQYFNGLPKELREKYQNNVGAFLKAVDDELTARAVSSMTPAVPATPQTNEDNNGGDK